MRTSCRSITFLVADHCSRFVLFEVWGEREAAADPTTCFSPPSSCGSPSHTLYHRHSNLVSAQLALSCVVSLFSSACLPFTFFSFSDRVRCCPPLLPPCLLQPEPSPGASLSSASTASLQDVKRKTDRARFFPVLAVFNTPTRDLLLFCVILSGPLMVCRSHLAMGT